MISKDPVNSIELEGILICGGICAFLYRRSLRALQFQLLFLL